MFKKTIRKSVFETNSSSTHSITLGREDFEISKQGLDVEGNVVKIYPGEFGWGPERFSDSATKASYALAWVKEYSGPREEDYLEMLEEVIGDVTGCEVEFVKSSDEDWGYIDHQSQKVGKDIFVDKDTLKNFIFNPNSILEIDHDNY